jgi:hypothetical protein
MWGQANVNESLETALIYVDTNKGSDSNPGTAAQPLKTIGKAAGMALSNNYKSIGSRVIINPGTYRESVTVNGGSANTSLPITFEAEKNGTVFVSGADVWTGWTPYSGNSSIYTQTWPYNWGLCALEPGAPTPQDIVLHQEMLIVNGTPLTEVLSLTAMQPGTFFPDETNSTVYVWPPAGTNMSTATVEVGTRPSIFSINGASNIVLRGLTFQYATTCNEEGAVTVNNIATNILIDTDNFSSNNAMGLAFVGGAQNFTVQSSVADHNGEMGFHTHQVKYGLWQNDTTAYNNWRGAQGAWYSWDTGGTKFMWDHNSTYNNLTTVFNQAHGAAFDTDNENAVLTSLVAVGNVSNGFFVEKSQGPVTFSNSYLCGNNAFSLNLMGGLGARNSTGVSVTGTTFFGNNGSQVFVVGLPGGITITNWETGQSYTLVTSDMSLSNNAVGGTATSQTFSDGYLSGTDWTTFVSSLSSNTNTWWANTNTNAFSVPIPKAWTAVDLNAWQSLTGQDASSTWASVSAPSACNVQSQGPDYWLLTSNVNPVTVSPTGSASYSVQTTALGGMSGTVNLSLDGLSAIPGATAAFTPTSVTTSGSSVLALTTQPTTPAGTYPLTIIGNNGSVTRTVTVSLVVPTTSVRLSTTSLSFASQNDGTTSNPQIVTLTNTGTTSLAISSISAGTGFGETNTCGSSVAAGANCTISVTFSPTTVGLLASTLQIKDGDPTSPQSVSLSGTGLAAPDVSVSPTTLGFGDHKVGTSTPKTVTLNNKGTGPLTISNMTITGTDAGDFTESNTCGASLAAAASCKVTVTFKPAAKGKRSATLSIYDNDVDSPSPQTVALSGTGS